MQTTNQLGIDLIKSFEGCVLHAYPDPATGGAPWTIGYGHAGPDVRRGMSVTQGEAEQLLKKDLAKFEQAVGSAVHTPLNANQHGALVSLCYNIGPGNFSKSTLVKRLNKSDYAGAATCFAQWNRANGKVMAGLTRRRAAEAKLFNTPVSKPVEEPVQTPVPASSKTTGLLAQLFSKLFRKG